jgi:hypothetical protein
MIGPCDPFNYCPSNFTIEPPSPPFEVDDDCEIDTRDLLYLGPGCLSQPRIKADGETAVIQVERLFVRATGKLRVTGPRALIIGVHGPATIDGFIDVSATGTISAGPGAIRMGTCEGLDGPSSMGGAEGGGGGSGGGLGTNGGNGGRGENSSAIATPGLASAGPLVPLRGGCAGGRGGVSMTFRNKAGGGRGGGAIQISSASMSISGEIRAQGGDGMDGAQEGGGGGGGSGGGILLENTSLAITGGAIISARGGRGGIGSGEGGGLGGLGGPEPDPDQLNGLDGDNRAPGLAGGGGGGGAEGIVVINGFGTCMVGSFVTVPAHTSHAGANCP